MNAVILLQTEIMGRLEEYVSQRVNKIDISPLESMLFTRDELGNKMVPDFVTTDEMSTDLIVARLSNQKEVMWVDYYSAERSTYFGRSEIVDGMMKYIKKGDSDTWIKL